MKDPMPTINDSGFTPTVLPPFSALDAGADYRTNAGSYRTKINASTAYDWALASVVNQGASEIVERVAAELIVTSL